MKRLCIFIAIVLTSFLAVSFIPKNVHADVNDFSFSSFDADYYLSKDSNGRSIMKVVERLTAEFVNIDQNRGIARAIPLYYDGHSVSFNFESMTRNGVEEPLYSQKRDGQFMVLSTRRDDFVNGKQKYTFTYTLRDVTKDFGDHQELYWDTNGTGWTQRFDNLDVRVHLDDSVFPEFTGAVSCYKGVVGSKTSCENTTDGQTISFTSDGPLLSHENLSFDLSFKAKTFAGYQITIADIMPYIFLAISVPLLIAIIYIKFRYGRDFRGKGTIIAEYLPPKDVSVLLAAEISRKVGPSSTAQILDLAVRHKIRIIEAKKKVLFVNAKKYTLELLNVDGLGQDELTFIDILFKSQEIGSQYKMTSNDNTLGASIQKLNKEIKEESVNLGYRIKQKKQLIIQSVLLTTFFIIVGSVLLFNQSDGTGAIVIPATILIFIGGCMIVGLNVLNLRPLTPSGRELYDYLMGLKLYIKLAEADRIRVLQSPTGAEKRPIDTNDTKNMVVLYERVLPYAVLFGQEKEWLKQLGNYYETSQSTPGWYSGSSAFNAAAFASSVSSFSSYSNSSSSSPSSGAGGGGSSGGGGGGGGGGGV